MFSAIRQRTGYAAVCDASPVFCVESQRFSDDGTRRALFFVWNVPLFFSFYWDSRAENLRAQGFGAFWVPISLPRGAGPCASQPAGAADSFVWCAPDVSDVPGLLWPRSSAACHQSPL
jgi:hypothetical protein